MHTTVLLHAYALLIKPRLYTKQKLLKLTLYYTSIDMR